MADYSKEMSFWSLIQQKDIVIPIIQRDYAQGRIGQEYLRERFLNKLFDALEENKPLVFDFVYGSTERGKFYPLDGQQRLTTLWLLHWYIAFVCGRLSDHKDVLKRFSYQTRTSSRIFCERLCEMNDSNGYVDGKMGIAGFIRNQRWYYSSYDQDPTIQSMMRMLGGTEITDKDDNDIVDGIEERFVLYRNKGGGVSELYNRLFSDRSPIRFFLLNMEDKNMPLTDDLYIKMNARGKVLTDFENFKVDLLGYKIDGQTLLIQNKEDSVLSFSHKIDTEWTDMFWCNRSEDNKIDDIMMRFFDRFFLDWYVARVCLDKNPEAVVSDNVYKNLTTSGHSYQNISKYESCLSSDSIDTLTKCLDGLHKLFDGDCNRSMKEVNRLFVPYWNGGQAEENVRGESTFYFIPKYDKNDGITKITQQQRVVFHAVVMYLSSTLQPNVDELKEWMRFTWNMVENSYIDREQAIAAIRFFENGIKDLPSDTVFSPSCITRYLCSVNVSTVPSDVFGRRQLLEEIYKAKRICVDGPEGEAWRDKLHEAEASLFFRGAIAFLFNNENGEPEDWENFDKKLSTAKEIFDNKGVKEEKLVFVLSRFYSLCTDFNYQLWWSRKVFNGMAKTWKENILTLVDRQYNYVYAKNVYHILLGDDDTYKPNIQDVKIKTLANFEFVKYILEKNGNAREMYIRWPHSALHFCGDRQGVLLDYAKRDNMIDAMLKDGRFKLRFPEIIIPDTGNYWGFDIDLIYNDSGCCQNIRWYREHNANNYDIYLMDEEWNRSHRDSDIENETGDRKYFKCFNVEDGMTIDGFIQSIRREMLLSDL